VFLKQHLASPGRDLLGAFFYLVALAGVLALVGVAYRATLETLPRVLVAAMPEPETSGSGTQEETGRDSRFAVWRITPQEAQKRFETRSASLFPPTPIPPMAENWLPPYAAMAKKQALLHARAQAILPKGLRVRRSRETNGQMPNPPAADSAPAPHATADPQMEGR
jgi:hypothetical protein